MSLLHDDSGRGCYTITTFDFKEYMRLDSSTVFALSLFPTFSFAEQQIIATSAAKSVNQKGPNQQFASSLYSLLNQCKTSMGSRKLLQWIRLPLRRYDELQTRFDMVEIFFENSTLRQFVRDKFLTGAPDLDKVGKRLVTKKASLHDCYVLYKFVKKFPELVDALLNCNLSDSAQMLMNKNFVDPVQIFVDEFVKFLELVENTIDLEEAEKNGEYLVQPSYNEDLQEHFAERANLKEKMEKHWAKVALDLGVAKDKTLKFENNKQFGFFFRLSKSQEKSVKCNSKYKLLESAKKDGVRFRDDVMEDLNRKYKQVVCGN